ncbi:MAG: sterol desaturase family protein, partial [Pseudomonadota bacterium]
MPSWNHRYDGPITVNPLFAWPPRPGAVLAWYVGAWFPVSISLGIVGLSFLALWLSAPTLEQARAPGWWMATILLRNFIVITALAGTLHWYFHGARRQGDALKYDPRPFPRTGRMFTWEDQLKDNVTWTLASGVPIWTAFEVLIWMAMAHGWAPTMTFAATPIWFVLAFFLIPIWESFYFYWIHRLLHSNWLYPVHALHHRNNDVGPWSGLSMHPVEHVLYFGTALIHFVVPTHPVHLICHLMFYALYAVTTHTGYEGLLARGAKRLHLGNFHHQIHHR